MIQVTSEIATGQFFDELVEADGQARPGADSLLNFLQDLSPQVLSESAQPSRLQSKARAFHFWCIPIP